MLAMEDNKINSENTSAFLTLSDEAIIQILSKTSILTPRDILNIELTCKRLNSLCRDQSVWSKRFGQPKAAVIEAMQFQTKPWTNVSNLTITHSDEGYPFHVNPTFSCAAVLNDTAYFGAKQQNSSREKKGNLYRVKAKKGWNRETRPQHVDGFDVAGPISCLSKCPVDGKRDVMAVGMGTTEDNIILYDVRQEEVICRFNHPMHSLNAQYCRTTQNEEWGITALGWRTDYNTGSTDKSSLYSTGGIKAACIQWDAETQQEVRRFVLNKNGRSEFTNDKATKRQRHQLEMHGIALPAASSLFVTSSHQHLYLWDERVSSRDGPIKIVDFYDEDTTGKNSKSKRPLKHLGFTNYKQSILTVFGDQIEGCKSYNFPDMLPAYCPDERHLDFVIPPESQPTSAYFSPSCVFATDVDGSLFVWKSSSRGLPTKVVGGGERNIVRFGYGANGVDYHSSGTVAISMKNSNPQADICGGAGYIWSIGNNVIDRDEDDKEVPRQNEPLFSFPKSMFDSVSRFFSRRLD